MRKKRIRALCRELIDELTLTSSATIQDLCAGLCEIMGRRMGRPVLLVFTEMAADGPFAVWGRSVDENDGPTVDIILCAASGSWLHRLQMVVHELSHELCGHPPTPLYEDEGSRLLFPDLDPALVRILGARSHYETENHAEELEAEAVATELTLQLTEWAATQRTAPLFADDNSIDARLWWSLGDIPDGRNHG
ncbi:hypothetical protein [Kutzneria sp. NPDC052558]|uniref:hypothetical protein n=1 Tax=Kutzneria sp. NPDC052558 TaxID=3364121 RepID=UPI0037C71B31